MLAGAPEISIGFGYRITGELQMSATKLPTTEQIEQRAYELYLERGGEVGHDVADWLAAERELTELPEEAGSEAPKVQAAAGSTQQNSPKAGRPAREVLQSTTG